MTNESSYQEQVRAARALLLTRIAVVVRPGQAEPNLVELIQALLNELKETEQMVVSGFYEEEVPTFRQGIPTHELEEAVTAEECFHWVNRIRNSGK